jgi:hypothetical protein
MAEPVFCWNVIDVESFFLAPLRKTHDSTLDFLSKSIRAKPLIARPPINRKVDDKQPTLLAHNRAAHIKSSIGPKLVGSALTLSRQSVTGTILVATDHAPKGAG